MNNTTSYAEEYLNVSDLIAVIWEEKLKLALITSVFAVLGVAIALWLPNVYKSYAILAPASENEGAGGLSALSGQFGGLASLAGINLGNANGTDKVQLAIEIINSRQFASNFIEKHNILPELLAAKSWDSSQNIVIYDESIYRPNQHQWVRDVSFPLKPKPSPQEAYKKYKEIVSISVSKETGMITLSVEHLSPYVAEKWVTWLIQDINTVMKKRELNSSQKNIEFLKEQVMQTNVSEMHAVLYKLIEEQTKTIMFSNAREEFVFTTIDPAIVPEEKFKPKRALICIIMSLVGGIVGVGFIILRNTIRR